MGVFILSKRLKVGVFLGYKIAYNLDKWRKDYLNDEANDTAPYGYDRVNGKDVNVEYISFNKFERKILFNKYLQYVYLYFIKLPIMLLKYDVIWTHYDKDGLYIAKLKSIPVVGKIFPKQISCFVWLIDNSREFDNTKKRSVSYLLRKIDKIIFHSPTEKVKFIEIFNCNEKKLQYVPFGINIEAYSPDKKDIVPAGIKDNLSGFILSVGTDIHRDMDLFKKITEVLPNYKFILASANPKYLQEKYNKNTIVLKANLQEIRWLYKKCLCVIIPLKYNEHVSGCTTILEAGAMHKPVIVSDVPGIREYLLENKTGLIVPVGDIDAMKESIVALINNPSFADELGENAFNYIRDKFTTDNWAKAHLELSREILKI
ncbi:MAG: hypothetical protein PWP67_789 [Clostridium butyricum]|nr:hypothetical protein [Thermoanaerobacterium sp.]MDK2827989.1 hypothetical protein [Clostridium butyricum]